MCLVCSETKSSIPSVDRLVKDMNITLTPSQALNAIANQLDIFQIAANPTLLGIGNIAAGGHVQCIIVIKMLLLPHPLWMTICLPY